MPGINIWTVGKSIRHANRAMLPTMARVPEIELLIRDYPELKVEYKAWVDECLTQGVAFFDRVYQSDNYDKRYSYTVDTTKFGTMGKVGGYDEQYIREYQMMSAGLPNVEQKIITCYHVTDYPKKALDTFYKMRSLVKQSSDDMLMGPGLYASTNPSIWLGRSEKRMNIIKNLTKTQREKAREFIIKDKDKSNGFLSKSEKERMYQYLDQFVERGIYFDILMMQPYNITPEQVCKWLGIKPYDPCLITFIIKGRYFDISELHREHFKFLNELATLWVQIHYQGKGRWDAKAFNLFLRDFKFDGMFQRASWNVDAPMIVVWNRKAVIDAKLERYSKWRSRW